MLTIYKASAGSGKTFTLALQYIRLLLSRPLEDGRTVLDIHKYTSLPPRQRPHSHILAITFTNKATAEMKSRIIKELDRLGQVPPSGCADSAYAPILTSDLGCSRAELADAAAKALRRLLLDYSVFNVSTIDTFFQTVLRSFAREIDLQGDYRLELDNTSATNAAVAMLFDDVNEPDANSPLQKSIRSWLTAMALDRAGEGGDFNLFNRRGTPFREITAFFNKTFNEQFKEHAAQIHKFIETPGAVDKFRSHVMERSAQHRTAATVAAAEVEAILAAQGLGVDSLNSSIAPRIALSLAGEPVKIDLTKKFFQALRDHSPGTIRGNGFFAKGITQIPEVEPALYAWYNALKQTSVAEVYDAVLKSLPTLSALSYIKEYIERFRQDNNLLLIADTNALLKDIIDGSEVPFIYEKVGIELHNFLIDEFQDTSKMQWDNLAPLLSNSMDSNSGYSLIIGDVKQSIYRWRGGESSLLDYKVETEDFPGRSTVKGSNPGENTNYRSAHDLVRFNNTVFTQLARYGIKDDHTDKTEPIPGYTGVTQSLPASTAHLDACINLRIAATDPAVLDSEEYAFLTDEMKAYCTDDSGKFSPERLAILRTSHEIMQQHERGYRWKDIAVINRYNKQNALTVEIFGRFFPEIKFIAEEDLKVSSSQAVKLVISIMKIMDKAWTPTPDTDGQLTLRDADRCALLISRFDYFMAHGSTVEQALAEALRLATTPGDISAQALTSDIDAIRADAPANLVALTESIISHKITPAQRAAEISYLNAFCDIVAEYSANQIPTLHSFLEYWETSGCKEALGAPEGADAVTVVTVHKSKGLEWECVHIPVFNWVMKPNPERGWYSTDGFTGLDEDARPKLIYFKSAPTAISEPGSPFADEVKRLQKLNTADNVNVAYVAFTRAVRELTITAHDTKGKGETYLLDSLLQALADPNVDDPTAMQTLPGSAAVLPPELMRLPDYYDTQSRAFSLGSPTTPAKPAEKTVKEGWKHRPTTPAPTAAPPFTVAFTALNKEITRIDDLVTDAWSAMDVDLGNDAPLTDIVDRDEAARDEAARRGIILHGILAQMESLDDLEYALAESVDPSEAPEYRNFLTEAFDAIGRYRELWFGDDTRRVLCEQTIYDGSSGHNYRPDRVVWTAEGTIDVIDYKFTAESSAGHAGQVRGYMRMLARMGLKNVRGFIWYVNRPDNIHPVT